MNKIVKLILISILFLQGCASQNAYTGNSQVNKTTIGAGIGAATGILAGVIAGGNGKERRKNALIGAAVGGLAGGGVGYYMDNQEAKLRARLRNSGVSVSRNNNQIILNMPGNISFDTNESSLKSSFYETLNSVVIVVKEFNKTNIVVAGHTDSSGSADYNYTLSNKRAASVADYLVNQGIPSYRTRAVGYGETRPIADNINKAGRAQNRRVEIQLTPM